MGVGEARTGQEPVPRGGSGDLRAVRNSQVFDLRCNLGFADRQVRLTAV